MQSGRAIQIRRDHLGGGAHGRGDWTDVISCRRIRTRWARSEADVASAIARTASSPTVFLNSGIVYVAVWLVYVAVWLVGVGALAAPAVAMTQLDAATVTPPSASLAGGIGGSMILVVAPRLQAVFIFSTSTVILRSRVLPSWLAIVRYVSGLRERVSIRSSRCGAPRLSISSARTRSFAGDHSSLGHSARR